MLHGLVLLVAALAGAILMWRLTVAAEADREDEPRRRVAEGDPDG